MKKISFVSLIAAALLFSACNGNSHTESTTSDSMSTTTNHMNADTNKMATDTGNRMSNMDTSRNSSMAPVDNDTKDFAKEAATGGMMEVQLGNIAQKNSANQSIKDFGQMMVTDHSKVNDELKDLASKKNVVLPSTVTEKQQKEIDNLSKKTGTDFDKAYVSMMVDDHKKDIDAFKKNGQKLKDPDFKNFIVATLPTLQKHLDSIQNIKKRM
jgi:putative membrane protein